MTMANDLFSGPVMTADIKRGLTGGRGRGLQRSVSNVSHLSPRARPICGVRAVTGVYRDNLFPQQHIRQQQSPARLATMAPAPVNRSFSNVSDLSRTYQRYSDIIRCETDNFFHKLSSSNIEKKTSICFHLNRSA